MSERKVGCECDRRRRGLQCLVCSIEVEKNAGKDSVREWVVGLLAQSVSERLLGVLEATEVAEGERSAERIVGEVAAHLRPRYSRMAS
jgi:hypothetical protein